MFAESSGLQPHWHHGGQRAWNVFLLRSTGFDRFFSLLLASIVLVAFVAAGLLAVWLTAGEPRFDRIIGSPIGGETTLMELPDGPDNPVDEFVEPFLPEATTTDISSLLASLPTAVEQAMEDGPGAEGEKRRVPGPPNSGPTPGDSLDRWRIDYGSTDLKHYKQQLAGLGIEFGVVSKETNEITRLEFQGNQVVPRRSNRAAEANSVYFVPEKRWLRAWDQRIASAAGIEHADSIIVHFLSPERVEQMLVAEHGLAAKDSRSVTEISRTIFIVAGEAGDLRLEPSEINYRDAIGTQREQQ